MLLLSPAAQCGDAITRVLHGKRHSIRLSAQHSNICCRILALYAQIRKPPQIAMPLTFAEIQPEARLDGVEAEGTVTVVAFKPHGETSGTLTYRTAEGRLGERLLNLRDLAKLSVASKRRWTFDADGSDFRLASEARRMKWAHLSDPFAAIDTSNIEPYPHQIDAVYNILLNQHPIRYVLADDPGAGKTIMSGLLIRELMIRGDVKRCLIISPGSLVEQWQDEMGEKFSLEFEIFSKAAVEASRVGNPFIEKNLLIARLDQLARSDEFFAKLFDSEWDLVIVDEAHKMSAHNYSGKLRKTARYQLGEMLREITRHLLFLTATPHNGKNDDFMAFMSLIDPDRFLGRLRESYHALYQQQVPDTTDVMRRIVKEKLCTFDGKRLFPKRYANALEFNLSELEAALYEEVTHYVRNGMNRADQLREKRRRIIIGFALASLQRRLASSPASIHKSLCRRRDRLAEQAKNLKELADNQGSIPASQLPQGVKLSDFSDFDYDEYDDQKLEELEDFAITAESAAERVDELEAEVEDLNALIELAEKVLDSHTDTKWIGLQDLLRSSKFKDSKNLRKLIVFTEYKDTLEYVADRISDELGNPEAVVRIHGGINRHDRRSIQEKFQVDSSVQVLVATDAAGEGVNLQAANMMVNYDLPWNPNRIEQRFGRIHRIGQKSPCHLWNLVAHETREGQVFTRLFEKIEQQREVYGDQVYDVLGDSFVSTSLRDLLMNAIKTDSDPEHREYMNSVIDHDIGNQLKSVLDERKLVGAEWDDTSNKEIKELMELSRARKLQPWFVHAFFKAALEKYGGRMSRREKDRFQISYMPSSIRGQEYDGIGTIQKEYERVTFDKRHIHLDDKRPALLISPGTSLLTAIVEKVLSDHGDALGRGAILLDRNDLSANLRLLLYFDHKISDGRGKYGNVNVVSRRFHYVEVDEIGDLSIPGNEPYMSYESPEPEMLTKLEGHIDTDWIDQAFESKAQEWAIQNLAEQHFEEIKKITEARVDKTQEAVETRLKSEIYYWDERTDEVRKMEERGYTEYPNSDKLRERAIDLEIRLEQRLIELDRERHLNNNPPYIVGAALIVPQGLIDKAVGFEPTEEEKKQAKQAEADRMETDRRAMEAVLAAERSIGRVPEAQNHSNPGYDILSVDPQTGTHHFIEVKGHLPQTKEITVSAPQVQKAKSNPERWRLAVVSVPEETSAEPEVRYLMEPFKKVTMHFAQTKLSLKVKDLLKEAVEPK